MNLEALITKLESKEGLEIEFKAAANAIPANVWETISAFANTNGGWILLGVADMNSDLLVQGLKNASSRH